MSAGVGEEQQSTEGLQVEAAALEASGSSACQLHRHTTVSVTSR